MFSGKSCVRGRWEQDWTEGEAEGPAAWADTLPGCLLNRVLCPGIAAKVGNTPSRLPSARDDSEGGSGGAFRSQPSGELRSRLFGLAGACLWCSVAFPRGPNGTLHSSHLLVPCRIGIWQSDFRSISLSQTMSLSLCSGESPVLEAWFWGYLWSKKAPPFAASLFLIGGCSHSLSKDLARSLFWHYSLCIRFLL